MLQTYLHNNRNLIVRKHTWGEGRAPVRLAFVPVVRGEDCYGWSASPSGHVRSADKQIIHEEDQNLRPLQDVGYEPGLGCVVERGDRKTELVR